MYNAIVCYNIIKYYIVFDITIVKMLAKISLREYNSMLLLHEHPSFLIPKYELKIVNAHKRHLKSNENHKLPFALAQLG